jgi:DNA-binding transcriptional LysR family regulator
MDRLQEMAVLVAVVDHGSLAAAARRLRRSAPAVTRALAALEQRAGVRLIERTTRRLAVTEAGRAVAERARALLLDYDAALTGVASAPLRGPLRITAPVPFGGRHVVPVVLDFSTAFPDIRVDLVLHDRNLDLIDEAIDVGVRIGPLQDSSLMARRLGEVRRMLVASPDYLARRGTPKRPRDLAGHDTIIGTTHADPSEWRFGPSPRTTVVRFTPRLLINDVEARLAAAIAGHGIVRALSYQVADALKVRRLVRLLPGFEPPPIPVHLVTHNLAAPKIRAFIDFAAPRLSGLDVLRPVVARR